MKGTYKKFDKSLFDDNDPKSRMLIKELFKKHQIHLKDNDDKYGVDLVSEDGKIKIEIERRLVWNKKEFPFNEINLPERKAKFFLDNSASYIIISKDYSKIGIIDKRVIKEYLSDENLKESKNRLVKNGEMFYKIPKSKFVWIEI